MKRPYSHIFFPTLVSVAVASAIAACSSDDDNGTDEGTGGSGEKGGNGGTSNQGGSGGSTSSGGKSSSGGSSAGGMVGSGGSNEELYTCFVSQVADPDPGSTTEKGEDCCDGFGTCTSEDDVDDGVSASLGHDDCDADEGLLCAPKDPADLPLGDGGLPTCTATYGDLELEGRCLPRCLTLGNRSAARLDAGNCPETIADQLGIDLEDVICAPCFNPIDGTSTGACDQFGDMPQEDAPDGFEECGSYMGGLQTGYCVPDELIADVTSDPDLLPQDICGEGSHCAPKNKVEDPNLCFAKCQAMVGGEGACVPTYIVEGRQPGVPTLLGKGTCEDGETCTPCLDPTAMGGPTPTGACEN